MDEENLRRAERLLREEFGTDWKKIAQELGGWELTHCAGRDLTSFMAFPERREGGKNTWRGNCSPEVVRKVISFVRQYLPFRKKEDFLLLDPMCGSGTARDAAEGMGLQSVQYDLNPEVENGLGGWDALKDEVEDCADMVFLHPPYHGIIKYSGNMWGKAHPDDLSRCENYEDFIDKLNLVMRKLFLSLRGQGFLALLVGDIRQKGEFHSIADDVMTLGTMKSWIVKGQFNCVSSSRAYSGRYPFVPITTEHLLLFQKEDVIQIPYSYRKTGVFLLLEQDGAELTWFALVCAAMEHLGGTASLQELYVIFADHPRAKKNKHYQEGLRAVIYEHRKHFQTNGRGTYRLKHMAQGG